MRWFWPIASIVAAIGIWNIDNLLWLHVVCCVFFIEGAAMEATKTLARSPADVGNSAGSGS